MGESLVPDGTKRTRTVPEDLDRRALMRLSPAERHAKMKALADACADEYNRTLDEEWPNADLATWGDEIE